MAVYIVCESAAFQTQGCSYTQQYGTGYALLSGRVISVGMWARNPLGGPSWHTSEGICSDSILTPCDDSGHPTIRSVAEDRGAP